MTPLLDLGALIAKPVSEVLGIISKATTDKDERLRLMTEFMTLKEQGSQAEMLALIAQQGEGFGRGGWFNDLVDGANRLVRPLVTYGLIALMAALVWYGMRDPMSLEQFAQAMAHIPSMMWALFVTVFGFWFGGRVLKDWKDFVVPQNVQTVSVKPNNNNPSNLKQKANGFTKRKFNSE